jgi:mannosyltransferase
VYPSLYEGFGIPVIEAQSAGCPIIAANRSSLPEIIGESGILLDDLSSACVSDAIKLLENNVVRDKYIKLGFQNAKKYSWQKMAKEYQILYKKLWEKC